MSEIMSATNVVQKMTFVIETLTKYNCIEPKKRFSEKMDLLFFAEIIFSFWRTIWGHSFKFFFPLLKVEIEKTAKT